MNYQKQMELLTAYNCKINLLYGEWARKQGMSYYTFIILFALWEAPSCTQKQIAESWMLPKQTVNTVIKQLEKQGYVELTVGRNQKEKLVLLTEAGAHFVAELVSRTDGLEEGILKRFGEADCKMLIDALQRFAEIFEEELEQYEK